MDRTVDFEFLNNSLLYRMSLGSRELYHSNVWAWLIEQDSRFVKVFFKNFDENVYNVLGVDREYAHRDLIIWLQKKNCSGDDGKFYYVIENKIKSLQSKKQLEDYSEDFKENKFLAGTFTGIENALKNETKEDSTLTLKDKFIWTFVSYDCIADGIRDVAVASKSLQICNHLEQIEEYCQIIKSVKNILHQKLLDTNTILNYDIDDEIVKVKLDDIFVKLKGADFLSYMEERRGELEALVPPHYKYKQEAAFHNGKATLDFKFDTDNDWNTYQESLSIGIQLEGYQFRRFVSRNKHYEKEGIFKDFSDVWFDRGYDRLRKSIWGKCTTLSKLYDSYGKDRDDYRFVYQYFDVKHYTYQQLFDVIKQDLAIARDIIDKLNK